MPEEKRRRIAVVVFADVTPDMPHGASLLIDRLLIDKLGEPDGREHTVRLGGMPNGHEFRIRIHEVMDVGVAAGNGYLWTQPTAKAYRQYEWQFEGEEAP